MLIISVGKRVCVRLKWGETEYTGKLVATDLDMNLLLGDTEEHILGEAPAKLGQVLIRYGRDGGRLQWKHYRWYVKRKYHS